MKRQQQPNKLQLNKKRRPESTYRDVSLSSSSLQSEALSSGSTSYLRRPLLPASRIATVEQVGENAASAKPRDEKSLLEKLAAEMEERKDHRGNIVKWTPLPPPNLELYLRKPVVLLEWDDTVVSNSELDLPDNRPTNEATAGDVIDVDLIADDDSLSDLDISQLTARLEDIEKDLSILGSQDNDHGVEMVENQGGVISKGGSDHIPPAPDFTDDGDNDDYGSGSDMDLFGDDDYDRLYDNVDQQLQQGPDAVGEEEDQRKSLSSVDFSLPALVEVGSQPPSMLSSTPIHPYIQGSRTDSHNRSHGVDVKKPVIQQHPAESPHPRGEGSSVTSKLHRSVVERTLETSRQFTDDSSYGVGPGPHHASEQQPAPWSRSSSSEYKFSPDSDDIDLPPVNWGSGSRPVASASSVPSTSAGTSQSYSKHMVDIKDEHLEQPKAHCSKDIPQSSSTSYHPPPLVAEKCPICNFSFPRGYTQLEVDEHVAVCLSAMDWEDQGAEDF